MIKGYDERVVRQNDIEVWMFEKRLRKYSAEISCGFDRYAKFHHWFIVHLKHSTVTVVSFGFLFISALFVSVSCIFSFIFISNSVHGFCFSLIETINRWKQFYAMISMSNQKLISFIQFSATEAQSPIKAFWKKNSWSKFDQKHKPRYFYTFIL